jgi:hypothetical protein
MMDNLFLARMPWRHIQHLAYRSPGGQCITLCGHIAAMARVEVQSAPNARSLADEDDEDDEDLDHMTHLCMRCRRTLARTLAAQRQAEQSEQEAAKKEAHACQTS